MTRLASSTVERYRRDGFHFPVPVLTPGEALGFAPEHAPAADLAPDARAHHAEAVARSAKILYRGTGVERFK